MLPSGAAPLATEHTPLQWGNGTDSVKQLLQKVILSVDAEEYAKVSQHTNRLST